MMRSATGNMSAFSASACATAAIAFFRAALLLLCLTNMQLLPYSLRRGGATLDFHLHGSIDRCCLRGRWESLKACRVYVHEGLVQLAGLHAGSCDAECDAESDSRGACCRGDGGA